MAKQRGNGGDAKRGWLHIRTDSDLDSLLDSAVKELKDQGIPANRSSVARMLIKQSLDGEKGNAVAGEALRQVLSVSEKVLKRALEDAVSKLPSSIQAELTG